MKKILALTLILALCQFGTAQDKPLAVSGGVARTAALGGGPTNLYITDYTDVYINPANALLYPDLLFADIGYQFAGYSANGQNIGFTLGTGGIAIGISIGREEGPMYAKNSYGSGTFANSDYMLPSLNGYSPIASQEPLAPVQLYAAFSMGPIKLGAAVYRAGWSQTDDGTGSVGAKQKLVVSNNQTGFKVGTLMGDDKTYLDASALLRFNGSSAEFTDNNPNITTFTNSKYSVTGTEFGANARFFLPLSDKLTFVPVGRYYTFAYEPEVTSTPAPTHPLTKANAYSRNELEIGAGMNVKVQGGLVAIGLSMQRISLNNDRTQFDVVPNTVTVKQKRVWLDLPKVNIGAELALNSWATARFGYFKRFSTCTTTIDYPAMASTNTPASTTETSNSLEAMYAPALGMASAADQQLSIGLGLTYDRIALDGYIADSMLGDMPYILSGKINGVFGVLSMSYKF
jgi:hypothetical protein